jgi:2-polyprenyl-6-methoxyphenol hydroxylase-like FAD-dependent oxidoreductase
MELFRKFGLMDGLLPVASPIQELTCVRGARVIRRMRVDQYGISYPDMVNSVRRQVPLSVRWKIGRVRDISLGSDVSSLTLMGGETITARLIVLACGTGGNIHAGLGIEKRMICERQSFVIGVNIARDDGKPFSFNALTYYPLGCDSRVAFLNLFPIRDVMRANLAVYRVPGEEWVTQFRQSPHTQLLRALPGLDHITGTFHIAGRVEMCPVDLYRVTGHVQPGLVLIGDCYQNVCPTSGMGVSKALSDVDALGQYVPEWLRTSGMGIDKISDFYGDPAKRACDERSIRLARRWRELSTNTSYLWKLCREIRYLMMGVRGWRDVQSHGHPPRIGRA